ncbi:hypothetical protein ABZS66_29805 [Dactylosporangium sp. NPDC005572]|uniref:hypothetical protein n=1 Tax=Dactylosporangium sp. NPDC005572 TaxID=3156889 RepID=UPI0033BC8983
MRLRQFRLVVAGDITEERADRLLWRAVDACVEAGPDGAGWVAFDRPAPTLVDAVVAGVRDLDAAGLVPDRATGDDPLVTVETVAERVGRPAEVVRGWALPPPVGPHPRRPVFDWPAVMGWLVRHEDYLVPDDDATLEAVTLALRVRTLAPRVDRLEPIRSLLYP